MVNEFAKEMNSKNKIAVNKKVDDDTLNHIYNNIDSYKLQILKYSPEFNTQLHPYSDFGVFKDIENPVYQYDLDGNFIKKWKNTAEVEHTLGFQIGNGLRNQSAGKFQ